MVPPWQVKECASRLVRLAKGSGITVFIVGHVTKSGSIAGPKVVEHMVDTVLYLEGDRFNSYRCAGAAASAAIAAAACFKTLIQHFRIGESMTLRVFYWGKLFRNADYSSCAR